MYRKKKKRKPGGKVGVLNNRAGNALERGGMEGQSRYRVKREVRYGQVM